MIRRVSSLNSPQAVPFYPGNKSAINSLQVTMRRNLSSSNSPQSVPFCPGNKSSVNLLQVTIKRSLSSPASKGNLCRLEAEMKPSRKQNPASEHTWRPKKSRRPEARWRPEKRWRPKHPKILRLKILSRCLPLYLVSQLIFIVIHMHKLWT